MKRPWKGTNPWRLVVRGGVQLALSAVVAWVCLQLLADAYDLAEAGLAEHEATIDGAATGVLVAAALVAIYSLVRLVVGIVDIASPRRSVEGVVADVARRRTGDVLPRFAQDVIYRHSEGAAERDLRRRHWCELLLDTAQGRVTFYVNPRIFDSVRPGTRVVVRPSRLLGHVSAVDPVAAGQVASLP